jgi:hypothetical protein
LIKVLKNANLIRKYPHPSNNLLATKMLTKNSITGLVWSQEKIAINKKTLIFLKRKAHMVQRKQKT